MNRDVLFISLNAVAILNIAVLCCFLSFRKNNIKPNYILSFIFVIPGLYFIDNLLIFTNLLPKIPYAFFVVQILANVFPIAIYYYFHLLLTDKKKYHKFLLLGSFITLLYSIGLPVFYSLLSETEQLTYLEQLKTDDYPISMTVYNIMFYVLQIFYLAVLYKEFKQYQTSIESKLTTFDDVKLLFVKQFVTLLAILNFSLVVFYIVLPMPIVDYGILPIVVTIIYIFIIYFTVKNNAIFNVESYQKLIRDNHELYNDEFKGEGNNSDVEDALVFKIEKIFLEDKIYRIPSLKLSDIAEKIDEKPYLISHALNSHFKKTFFEMVNEFRVEEAIELLASFDSKSDKIENIAYKVGFNSRASFYRVLKKSTGKSPSDFVSTS